MGILSAAIEAQLKIGDITALNASNIHDRTGERATPLHILLLNGHGAGALECIRLYNTNLFLFLDEFFELLQRHPDLITLPFNAAQLELLYSIVDSGTPSKPSKPFTEIELTMTDVYLKILSQPELHLRWFYNKTGDLDNTEKKKIPKVIAARIEFIETCAQLSWESGQKELLPEHIEIAYDAHRAQLQVASLDLLLQTLGILKSVSQEADLTRRRWEFPHRSIQEYFTACAYVRQFQSKKRSDAALPTQRQGPFTEENCTRLVLPFVVGLLTRGPNKQEALAKKLCATVRPKQRWLRIHPLSEETLPEETDRLKLDMPWFTCITEIPWVVLSHWEKKALLGALLGDLIGNKRLIHTFLSAKLLGCEKFIRWANEESPKLKLATLTFSNVSMQRAIVRSIVQFVEKTKQSAPVVEKLLRMRHENDSELAGAEPDDSADRLLLRDEILEALLRLFFNFTPTAEQWIETYTQLLENRIIKLPSTMPRDFSKAFVGITTEKTLTIQASISSSSLRCEAIESALIKAFSMEASSDGVSRPRKIKITVTETLGQETLLDRKRITDSLLLFLKMKIVLLYREQNSPRDGYKVIAASAIIKTLGKMASLQDSKVIHLLLLLCEGAFRHENDADGPQPLFTERHCAQTEFDLAISMLLLAPFYSINMADDRSHSPPFSENSFKLALQNSENPLSNTAHNAPLAIRAAAFKALTKIYNRAQASISSKRSTYRFFPSIPSETTPPPLPPLLTEGMQKDT